MAFFAESVLIVLIIPFAFAILTKVFVKNEERMSNIIEKLSVLPMIFLALAIVFMFASQGQILIENLEFIGYMLIPILLFFVINFFVSQIVEWKMKCAYEERASLTLTTLARNSPTALAIAMTAFPHEPLIAVVLVIGPLLELPILALITQALLFLSRKEKRK